MQFSVNHYNSSRTTSYKFNLTTGFRILVERLRGSEGDNRQLSRDDFEPRTLTGSLCFCF